MPTHHKHLKFIFKLLIAGNTVSLLHLTFHDGKPIQKHLLMLKTLFPSLDKKKSLKKANLRSAKMLSTKGTFNCILQAISLVGISLEDTEVLSPIPGI